MRRRHLLRLSAVLLAGLWLAGCASPHYLQLNPKRSAAVPQTGSGQQITVVAVDGRDSEVIGTRSGSAMSTATITVSAHELVPRLQDEAERAVREMGFTPTTERAQGRPSLTLTLDHLGYGRGQSRPVIDEARLEAVFIAEAVNGGNTYTGTYTSRRTQSFALRPDRDTNTRMVNDLLSDGLDRAFRDPELGRLLAR
ncbi:YajG family lipoprotein [Halomonas sp. EGI 63088]|uniref:YajG family lipoprotein n=1 Tax=Halomonas flagellata TaxID=2920385 RepID=A0ABS9RZF8_9GAMM|nr:YajG family lipoprotein [Halomonas flagellata]MCH4565227.1 YajG family lipoprotein [Halomonas flagellata]